MLYYYVNIVYEAKIKLHGLFIKRKIWNTESGTTKISIFYYYLGSFISFCGVDFDLP